MCRGFGSPARATLDESISGEGIDDASISSDVVTEKEIVLERLQGKPVEIIQARMKMLGANYPFEFNDRSLTLKPDSPRIYEGMLAIAKMVHDSGEDSVAQYTIAFERMAMVAASVAMGEGTESYRMGHPPDGDRPVKFIEAVRELHGRTGEFFLDLSANYGFDDPKETNKIKDGGIDFVVWKKSIDSRVGMITALGQCACGGNFKRKGADIDEVRLNQLIRPISFAMPFLKLFAVPYMIDDEISWRRLNTSHGLILDRARITMLVAKSKESARVTKEMKKIIDESRGINRSH